MKETEASRGLARYPKCLAKVARAQTDPLCYTWRTLGFGIAHFRRLTPAHPMLRAPSFGAARGLLIYGSSDMWREICHILCLSHRNSEEELFFMLLGAEIILYSAIAQMRLPRGQDCRRLPS